MNEWVWFPCIVSSFLTVTIMKRRAEAETRPEVCFRKLKAPLMSAINCPVLLDPNTAFTGWPSLFNASSSHLCASPRRWMCVSAGCRCISCVGVEMAAVKWSIQANTVLVFCSSELESGMVRVMSMEADCSRQSDGQVHDAVASNPLSFHFGFQKKAQSHRHQHLFIHHTWIRSYSSSRCTQITAAQWTRLWNSTGPASLQTPYIPGHQHLRVKAPD